MIPVYITKNLDPDRETYKYKIVQPIEKKIKEVRIIDKYGNDVPLGIDFQVYVRLVLGFFIKNDILYLIQVPKETGGRLW